MMITTSLVVVSEAKTQQPLILQQPSSFVGDFDYTLAPYSGCAYGCLYCYVPHVLKGLAERRGGWGSYVDVRSRCVTLLQHKAEQLAGKSIFLSATTDPYQPIEAQTKLTWSLLEALAEIPFGSLLISTRSGLILRDLDVLTDPRMRHRVEVGVSIPSDLPKLHAALEPRTASFKGRFMVLSRLKDAGIATRVHAAPLGTHSPDFIRIVAQSAHWLWVDGAGHGARKSEKGAQWLSSYQEAQRFSEQAAAMLGTERVGYGRDRFAWRWNGECIVPPAVRVSVPAKTTEKEQGPVCS